MQFEVEKLLARMRIFSFQASEEIGEDALEESCKMLLLFPPEIALDKVPTIILSNNVLIKTFEKEPWYIMNKRYFAFFRLVHRGTITAVFIIVFLSRMGFLPCDHRLDL